MTRSLSRDANCAMKSRSSLDLLSEVSIGATTAIMRSARQADASVTAPGNASSTSTTICHIGKYMPPSLARPPHAPQRAPVRLFSGSAPGTQADCASWSGCAAQVAHQPADFFSSSALNFCSSAISRSCLSSVETASVMFRLRAWIPSLRPVTPLLTAVVSSAKRFASFAKCAADVSTFAVRASSSARDCLTSSRLWWTRNTRSIPSTFAIAPNCRNGRSRSAKPCPSGLFARSGHPWSIRLDRHRQAAEIISFCLRNRPKKAVSIIGTSVQAPMEAP